MASKKVSAVIKLQCPAGAATPAPPIGPALGPHGVSAPKFVQEFNDRTKNMEKGLIIPVVLTVYQDKSYTFILKTPPAAVLIKKAAKIEKASGKPNREKVATLTKAQVKEIAEQKNVDAEDLKDIDKKFVTPLFKRTVRGFSSSIQENVFLMQSRLSTGLRGFA